MIQIKTTETPFLSDSDALETLGRRIAGERLQRNLSQEQLAIEAGLSRSTVRRMEGGESTQMSAFLRVLRALGLLDNLELLIPAPGISPIRELERSGRERQRASSKRTRSTGDAPVQPEARAWTWGEEE